MDQVRILDPTARAEAVDLPAVGSDGFQNRRVALLTNLWPSWDVMTDHFAADLESRFNVAETKRWEVPISEGAPEDALDEIASGSDVALVGLAN